MDGKGKAQGEVARLREMNAAAKAAEDRVAQHKAATLRRLTRLHGGTYDQHGLKFRGWKYVRDRHLADKDVATTISDDLKAAQVAGDDKRVAELLKERSETETLLAEAVGVFQELDTRAQAARRGADSTVGAYLAAVGAALREKHVAPAEAALAEARAAADAELAAATAEVVSDG